LQKFISLSSPKNVSVGEVCLERQIIISKYVGFAWNICFEALKLRSN